MKRRSPWTLAWFAAALFGLVTNVVLQAWGWALVMALCTAYWGTRLLYEGAE